MKTNSTTDKYNGLAVYWDESFLWGLMVYMALRKSGLPFDLVRTADIKKGCLDNYTALLVPGGWSSNKIKALGEDGRDKVIAFVRNGGNYAGFCGGAGLATLDGIGLLAVGRRPTKDRVPSFSGKINLALSDHELWTGINEPVFHAWWPPQFTINDESIKILARYGKVMQDAFSSDLNVGDVDRNGDWRELERIYRINLDPDRLLDEPAVIERNCGKGKVVLSLVHFDTPDDENGATVLRNLWRYVSGGKAVEDQQKEAADRFRNVTHGVPVCDDCIVELERTVDEIIDFGSRNFLWYWRNPMLLQWRRGVRGLEYCTLYVLTKEICRRAREFFRSANDETIKNDLKGRLEQLQGLLSPFASRAQALLARERLALQNGFITYDKCDDEAISRLRAELFSGSKSYGGEFKALVDSLDDILYDQLHRTT